MFGVDRRIIIIFGIFFFFSVVMSWGNAWIDNQIVEIQSSTKEVSSTEQKTVKKKRKKMRAGQWKIDAENDPLAPVMVKKEEPKKEYQGPKRIYDFSPPSDVIAQ